MVRAAGRLGGHHHVCSICYCHSVHCPSTLISSIDSSLNTLDRCIWKQTSYCGSVQYNEVNPFNFSCCTRDLCAHFAWVLYFVDKNPILHAVAWTFEGTYATDPTLPNQPKGTSQLTRKGRPRIDATCAPAAILILSYTQTHNTR